jgi:hypothetical protein
MKNLFGLTGIWGYVASGVIVLALVVLIVFGVRGCAQDERVEDNQMINTGQTIEREAGHQEVINHVEQAKDATTNPTTDDLNVVCSKYDRNCPNNQ